VKLMKLNLPTRAYEGYIFDCDGTLADTMPLHYRAWSQALAEQGAPFIFAEEDFYFLGGTPSRRIIEIFNERYATTLDEEEVAQHKEKIFLTLIDQVQPIHAVVAYAEELHAAGKKLAVASGGAQDIVRRTLELLKIDHYFTTIVTAEQVVRGKPFPEMFLLAASRLEAAPANCLVFEDTPTGVQAAVAAGMDYVLVESR
jgi:HAD superfamily hydrolase (TIGR01509 family)